MTNLVLAICLLVLALVGVVVRKTYFYLPGRELKRQAQKHDPLAVRFYRVVAYGDSLRTLLWLYIGLTSAAGLVLLARALNPWISLLVVGPSLWIIFSFTPATRITRAGAGLTRLLTPLIAWLLNYLHRPLSRLARLIKPRYIAGDHTLLFEREDLMALLQRQGAQADNRLSEAELQIVKRALSFADRKVSDILLPTKKIKTVNAKDVIGPVLIDELHKSAQPYALVRDKPKGQVVGTLAVAGLGLDSSGQVSDSMDHSVYYLHEDDSLSEALHAFFVTNHSMFVVVNSFEEFVGIVTLPAMITQLLGAVPGSDFDGYADPAQVAARHMSAKQAEPATKKTKNTAQTPENVVE